uniref:Regulator of telomere elongation helicase 1 homolog n=1 Tax=Macrostomum lignano TaxID=282301 RepID=A0A1I8IUR6_9PLAT
MDIEDLVDYGKRTKCCPYFMSRDQKESRRYNIYAEQVCEDGASVELSSVDLAQCIFEIDAAVSGLMKKITADQQASSLSLENLSGAEAQESLDFTVSDLFALKGQLLALEKAIDSIPLGSGDSAGPGFTKPGAYVLELLAQADITAPRVAHMLDRLDKILAFMSSTQGRLFRGTGLSRLSEFIAGVFPQSSYCDPAVSSASGSSSSSSGSSTQRRRGLPSSSSGLAQCYKLHIREVSGGHYGRSGATSAPAATVGFDTDASAAASSGPAGSGKPYRLLSYWCFSPAKAMLDLAAHGVRSIILTSGTLYPMEALRQDLQLPFPIELSNPHVIDRDQIITAVVPRGPNSVRLSSGYENRDSLDYQRALGECVASLCGCVPHGLLVFFPSYSLMSRCLDAWRSSRLFDRISSRKPVFVEPRRKAEFATAFADYYKRVCDPQYAGAIFLAVCRGKVSEGLDFADHFGRAVVVTGLPYPMWTDPRVRLKQAWLDEQRLATGRGLTGKQWYKQQAYRAVNQAIGRVLRHRNDYGAVLLCDERFATEESRRQLPAWLQHSVTVAKTFESVPDRLREFFASNSVKYPTPDGPKMRLPAKQQQMQFDGQSAAAFEFGSAATHQLKAQAGAGPVYGSSVSPLIGGGRAGTEEMAQNSVQTPSESASSRVEEGAAGRSKHVAFQTESAAESQADAAAAVKQDGDFKVPLAAPPNSRRRLRISGSVAKSSLSPSPSPSATPKPTPASPSNPFSKPSPPSPDVSELRLTLQQALGQGERCRFRSALAEYKSSGGVDRLIGRLAEIFQAAARVASAGGPRGEPAAVRQLLFGLGRLIRTPDRARYEQCRERLAEAAADGLAKAVAAITGGGAVLADQSTAASKAKVDDLDEGEDDDDGAALRPPAKRLKSGMKCEACKTADADTPLAAPCDHICCFLCWRSIIEVGVKQCPRCKLVVRRRSLRKLTQRDGEAIRQRAAEEAAKANDC